METVLAHLEVPIHPLLSVDELQIHVLVDGTQIPPSFYVRTQCAAAEFMISRRVAQQYHQLPLSIALHSQDFS